MKMLIAGCLLLVTNVFSANAEPPKSGTAHQTELVGIRDHIGRYQLFQGTYTTLDLKFRQSTSSHNAVFLLDTVTGQVKRYVNRIDEDGTYIETWLPTDKIQQMEIKKPAAAQPPEGKQER